jgi:hypothetical protein
MYLLTAGAGDAMSPRFCSRRVIGRAPVRVTLQSRVAPGSHPDGLLVAGAAVALALGLSGPSLYRRPGRVTPTYARATARSLLGSPVGPDGHLGGAWLSGLPVEAVLATPDDLALPTVSPVVVAGAVWV